MFYEKRVTSFRALMKEVRVMDSDAGIRLVGEYGGHACYCFVTRFGELFTAMIYTRPGGKKGAPGRMLASVELKSVEQLRKLLREISGSGVNAYVY